MYAKWVPLKKESWTIFQYEYIARKWQADDHEWSPDKDKYDHIYSGLEVDKCYLILSVESDLVDYYAPGQKANRWVWLDGMEMTEHQLRKVEMFYQLRKKISKTQKDAIRDTIQYANDLKYPKINLDRKLANFFEF